MTALPIALMSDDEVAHYGRGATDSDAGFGALRCEHGLLPLTAMDVDARVTGIVASIEVAQTFVNTLGTAIEATYIFPLPDRAAVTRFRMEVAGRVVEGVVEERGAAREQYDEAIAAGHRAAITEEERAGVFTLRVGNLMPGESATVRLSLVGALPVDDGEVTFRFPLVVAPRYMPGTALGGDQAGLGLAADTAVVPDASRISPPVRLPGIANPVRLGIRVALADHTVRDVASSLHLVSESHRDAKLVQLAQTEKLDRDFILRWRIDGAALQSSLTCVDDLEGNAGTFLLAFVPPSTTAMGAKPRDVVFVIDRSGSMGGWKMVAARRAAARMIDTLTSRDRFCAIAFDDRVEGVPSLALAAASDRARFQAVEQLAKVEARGGTELLQPLQLAAQLLAGGHSGSIDRERVIVLVTDGQVGNEDHILRELAPQLQATRMFTLGIDQAVNAAFLRRLAAVGGGLCELVESEDRLDAVMAKVHRRIGLPIATELALVGEDFAIETTKTAPRTLPDVYAGAPVTIFGRYRGKATATSAVTVRGKTLGESLETRLAATVIPNVQGDGSPRWLAASWARAYLRDLDDRYAKGDRSVEAEIVSTSKQFQVLSRFTAFLAIDRSAVVNRGGKLHQAVQPVESPAGWDQASRSRAPMAPGGPPMMPMMPMGRPMAMPAPAPAPMSGGALRTLAAIPQSMASPMSPSSIGGRPVMPTSATMVGSPEPLLPDAYRASLGVLMRELEAQATGRADAAAIRVLRMRLAEWVEDVRSTGSSLAIATEVEQLVLRLTAALAATGATLANEATAVATALAAIVDGGGAGPLPTPPPKPSRLAFWK